MEKCKHAWSIVLGLVKSNGSESGYFEYQAKCDECGERCRLTDEIMQHVFKNGGPNG